MPKTSININPNDSAAISYRAILEYSIALPLIPASPPLIKFTQQLQYLELASPQKELRGPTPPNTLSRMDSETETVRSQPTAPSPPPNGNGYMESIEKSPKATQLTESLPPQTHHQLSSELLASIPDPGEHVDRQSEHDFSVYESADEDPEPSDREDEEPISISIQIDGFPKSPAVDSPSTPHPYKQSRFDVERDETATPTPPPQPSTLSPNPGEDGELEVIGLSGTDTGSGNEGTPRPRKKRPKRRTPPPATVPPPRSILGGNSAIQDDGVYGFTLNNGSEYRRREYDPGFYLVWGVASHVPMSLLQASSCRTRKCGFKLAKRATGHLPDASEERRISLLRVNCW